MKIICGWRAYPIKIPFMSRYQDINHILCINIIPHKVSSLAFIAITRKCIKGPATVYKRKPFPEIPMNDAMNTNYRHT